MSTRPPWFPPEGAQSPETPGLPQKPDSPNLPPPTPTQGDATQGDATQGEPGPLVETSLWVQIRRSLLRHGLEDTPQNRVLAVVGNFLFHLHPVRIPGAALRLRATFCAGGLALLMFLVTLGTGLLLMIHYRPVPELAHGDVLAIIEEIPYGSLIRALHRYAGDVFIIVVVIHMVRVLLHGAFRPPREFNWVLGVALLVITLGIAFTGYLLPWTQKGYWATAVAGGMLGAVPLLGAEGPFALLPPGEDLRAALLGGTLVGGPTLLRFYLLHCVALPLAAMGLMGLHFWRVRKDGFSGGL